MELIKDRIAHILRAKNLTATQFAEMMQIQPSNVSHLLSGRNKPSLDFLVKLKEIFPEYNFDWIILGKKPITTNEPNLFNNENNEGSFEITRVGENNVENANNASVSEASIADNPNVIGAISDNNVSSSLKQIIYVYEDKTFEVYNLRK
ncbi:MAG: helix-turn-helix transcriptional regulator [Bacteroidales bacterium]|nr:helix-turn-helix transcriptional regulator [Bacteroidales bacterium]